MPSRWAAPYRDRTTGPGTVISRQADGHDGCRWYGAGRVGIDTPQPVPGTPTLVAGLPADVAEYGHVARALAGQIGQNEGRSLSASALGPPKPCGTRHPALGGGQIRDRDGTPRPCPG